MTDHTRAAREDLAFLKAIVEDKGPLPMLLGGHMLAVGVPYGLNFILIWAIFAGYAPWWPHNLAWATWLPGTALYLPLCLWLTIQGVGLTAGPTARLFIAACSTVGLMVLPMVSVMIIAHLETGIAFDMLWPTLAFVLWGGAWASLGIIRRKVWHGGVAAGSMATALASAAMIKDPAVWLVMSAGTLMFVALPGAAIVLRVHWAD